MGDLYTITMDSLTTLSTKSWEPILPFPSASPRGFNEVRNCCASSPWCRKNSTASCRCWISSKSYKGAQTQCLKRPWRVNLTMSTWQCPHCKLMVDFRITQISVGGEPKWKPGSEVSPAKKGLRVFFLESLVCEKKGEGQFFGNFFQPKPVMFRFQPPQNGGVEPCKGQ